MTKTLYERHAMMRWPSIDARIRAADVQYSAPIPEWVHWVALHGVFPAALISGAAQAQLGETLA